jgi:hypothetical protein
MINTTTDNGELSIWVDGTTYLSYNTGETVKEETFWYQGLTVEYLMSDPTDASFLAFFF